MTIDENGNRPGFRGKKFYHKMMDAVFQNLSIIAAVLNMNARLDQRAVPDPNYIYNWGSEIYMENIDAPLYETVFGWITYYRVSVGFAYANTTFKNVRTYQSLLSTGEIVNVTQSVPAAHYCENGCGGGLVSNRSVFYYNYGTCVSMNQCQ